MNKRMIICYAVLLLFAGTLFGQLQSFRKSRSYGNQQSDSLSEIEDLLRQVNGDSIAATIQDLQNFGSRYEYAPGRNAASEYIYDRFQKYGLETFFDTFESGVQHSVNTAASPGNSGKIWVTGYNGIIQCSEDSGKTWITQKCLFQDNLTDMFFIDTLSGWCAGNYGDVYGTRNSGKTWEKLSNIYGDWIRSIDFIDSLRGWAVGRSLESGNSNIYFTSDGGTSWNLQFTTDETNLRDLCYIAQDSVFVVGSNGMIAFSPNGGSLWELKMIADCDLNGVDFADSKTGWIVGGTSEFWDPDPEGYIFKTTDGGDSWHVIYTAEGNSIKHVDFYDESVGWAAGYPGGPLYTSDGGETWHQIKQVGYDQSGFEEIVVKSPDCCLLFQPGRWWYTEDAGTTWSEHTYQGVTHPSENVVGRILGSVSPDTVVILGAHYDSIVWDRPMDYAPGADDNASGVAALIELARIFSQADLKYSVEFIAFSCEEVGGAGGRHYAALAEENEKKIKVMINFDMVGYSATPEWKVLLWGNDDSGWLVNMASDMAMKYAAVAPEKVIYDLMPSDGKWFMFRGYPTLLVIESDYEQSSYHTPQDEFGTLVIPFEVEIVKLGLATLCNLNGLSTGAENIHELSSLPGTFELDQNYPNPFNPSTTIHFTLPEPCFVSLKIYDLLGKHLDTLISEQKQSGEHRVEWTAEDLPCGIYLYRLKAGDIVETKKMILQK